jgi:molybdopterin molybdotransferase
MSLLAYEEAIERVLQGVPRPHKESLPLQQGLGRVLASAISANMPLPPFRKSFMDGYALRTADVQDVPSRLKVVSTLAAGDGTTAKMGKGEAVQIMTGAPVPEGADAVQMVEKTRPEGHDVVILERVELGAHIAEAGSEVQQNEPTLKAGAVIGPQEIALLATFGHSQVEVYRQPRVSVIATGDELVEVEAQPGFGKIRNSNAYMLWAQCRELGLEVEVQPIVRDEPAEIRDAIMHGLKADLVILTGGVSMGEFDYVHKVLAEEEIQIFFHKVAIKPGKPVLVGAKGDKMVFGLPGNPISSFLTFEIFAKPAILKWSGKNPQALLKVIAVLDSDVRHKPGRLFFKPAYVVSTPLGFSATPIEIRGSADVVGFARANALMALPASGVDLAKGAALEVLLLPGRVYDQW